MIIKELLYKEYIITSSQLIYVLTNNKQLQNLILKEKILLIDNMLVINNPLYVNNKSNTLTEYGEKHISECCIKFEKEKIKEENKNIIESKNAYGVFISYGNKNKYIKPEEEQFQNILEKQIENASYYENNKYKLPLSFHETLYYHYKKAKEKRIIKSYEHLEFETGINEKTIRDYKNAKIKPSKVNIIKLGLAMKLSAPYIIDMLQKADYSLSHINEDNIIFSTILYCYSRLGLEKVFIELRNMNKEDILELPAKYLENHNLL